MLTAYNVVIHIFFQDLLLSILETVLVPSPCSHCEDARSDILSGAIYGSAEVGGPS